MQDLPPGGHPDPDRRYEPPVPQPRPAKQVARFGERPDPWHWLRDESRTDAEVRSHLGAEAVTTERWFKPLTDAVRCLQEEHAALVPDEESDLPVLLRGYWYETRYVKGAEHPQYVRRKIDSAEEEILYDAAAASANCAAYSLGSVEVSDDGTLLAVTEDRLGSREYALRLIDRASGVDLPDTLSGMDPDIVFLADRSLLYVAQDPVTLLGNRVMRHVPGTSVTSDEVVYEEDDERYTLSIERSRSGRFVFIYLQSTITTEVRYLNWTDPFMPPQVAIARQEGHEYAIEDDGGTFILRTNDAAPDFRLVEVAIERVSERACWQEILPSRPGVILTDCLVFPDCLVVEERVAGLLQVRIIDRQGNTRRLLRPTQAAASLWLDANADSSVGFMRYAWGSLTQPTVRERIHLADHQVVVLRIDPVGGTYRFADYEVQRCNLPARDGTEVPVTLLRRKTTRLDGTAPLVLTAYGAYGVCYPTSFDRSLLPLVDRGVVYGIAHVRGGGELGRHWYDAGRLLHKRHTFEDFVDVRRALVAAGTADGARCAAVGASAGGLLVGVIANEAAADFGAIVAHVPFVDILSSMLDEDLPLTTLEYEEWGHPGADPTAYEYMLAYSPYDNLRAQAYPAVLATAALHDSQVQYWESAKWVARMRECQTGDAPILLHMHLDAGHAGATGRFGAHKDIALEQAFLMERLGVLDL